MALKEILINLSSFFSFFAPIVLIFYQKEWKLICSTWLGILIITLLVPPIGGWLRPHPNSDTPQRSAQNKLIFSLLILISMIFFISMFSSNSLKYNNDPKSFRFGSGEFFDPIADIYDITNKFLTFGYDINWRKDLIDKLHIKRSNNILDLATGTADVPILMVQHLKSKQSATNTVAASIVIHALDPSKKMLEKGQIKLLNILTVSYTKYHMNVGLFWVIGNIFCCICYVFTKINQLNFTNMITLHYGNSENMQKIFSKNNYFDVITMSFGIRNVEFRNNTLLEMKRLLKKGGRIGIMEFSAPQKGLLKPIANVFIQYILPYIASIFSIFGTLSNSNTNYIQEYTYLKDSIYNFPSPDQFKNILTQVVECETCDVINAFQNIVYIYICKK